MAQPITGLGNGGVNTDQPPSSLAPNVFSNALNVRFDDNSVSTTTGETTYRTVSISPDFGVHWRRPDAGYNIFAKDGDIVRVNSAGVSSVMFTGGSTYVCIVTGKQIGRAHV